MTLSDLNKIDSLPHLSSFSITRLLTELCLYEKVLISTQDVVYSEPKTDCDSLEVSVSDDVRVLHEIFLTEKNIVLPCPCCKEDRPFSHHKTWNPFNTIHLSEQSISEPLLNTPGYFPECDGDNPYSSDNNLHFDVFNQEPHPPKYEWGNNTLALFGMCEIGSLDKTKYRSLCGQKCKKEILHRFKELRIDLQCTLDSTHIQIVDFLIIPAVTQKPIEMTAYQQKVLSNNENSPGITLAKTHAEELAESLYYKHRESLLLIKIGQYPSLKDLQLFDTKKYRKMLDKYYSDYTLALALYADGVGAGAFVYLRRILEHLVENIHQKYITMTNTSNSFSEEDYRTKHFNDKISYLETSFGITIIPHELNTIRNIIYGVLSKGIHELSEEDCKKIFPAAKYIIDSILDQQIQQQEKEKRLKEVKQVFSSLN